jgi:hypothetical protein
MWIIIAIAALTVIGLLSTSWWRNQERDMGAVSGQWLAEHRQSQES